MSAGKVRIIGGNWRGRKLEVVEQAGLRPTPDRVRETLFNWLQFEIAGRQCLDLFAGSGALGFEAASRGAKGVVMLDKSRLVSSTLTKNAAILGAENVTIVQDDVAHYLARLSLNKPAKLFDVVFVDPPYDSGLLAETCHQLESSGCLQTDARIYIEQSSTHEMAGLPEAWAQRRSKNTSQVGYHLFDRMGEK